ncbi:glycerophosphodiester phosphodiesterase domain-containing protein 5 [Latimeria chalumnae]|uniref:glycerophosphodiester phosphodiesterase domain-containing protein 5 n=1 Tax=Latimeria chalumnae TaxID=7897 RepID=UPI00313D8BCC
MGSTPITLSKIKLGKLKIVRRRLLQRYEYQPFTSCLAGLYGCQWKRYQRVRAQPGECCCNKVERLSFVILIGTFCLALVLLYFWCLAQNDYDNFDWFNFWTIGYWFPWSLVLLAVTAAFFIYIALLLVLAVCLLSEGQRLYLHWTHKIGILVVLSFTIAALAVLSDLWNEEWQTTVLSFQFTAPYLHIGGVAAMTLLAWPVAIHFARVSSKVSQTAILGLFLAILLTLYLVPLGMYSPCIKEEGTLGPRPALLGHRGAPMLAPENTQMAFEKTVEEGGSGFETDVTISYDGVPFLMHDKNLKRTTNVQEVFPNRTSECAAMFYWHELEELNAGKWFLKDNPFGTKASMSIEDQQKAENQSVYRLSELLKLADQKRKLVIFDLYLPPVTHPYRDSYINRTLEVILNEARIDPALILWLPNDQRSFVHSVAPGFQQTWGERAPIEEMQRTHTVKLNLQYNQMSSFFFFSSFPFLRKYSDANITTNLYVVSEPWVFSLAWCAGTHSVTTNAIHILKKLKQPLFLMVGASTFCNHISAEFINLLFFFFFFLSFCFGFQTYRTPIRIKTVESQALQQDCLQQLTPHQYKLMWILTDVVSAVLIIFIFSFHWWRERGLPCCSNSRERRESGLYSKFRTELNDVWSVSGESEPIEVPNTPTSPNLPTISEVHELTN